LKSPLQCSHLLWSVVPLGKPGGFHSNAGERANEWFRARVHVPGASEDKRGVERGRVRIYFGDDVGMEIPLLLFLLMVNLLRLIILVE
jgi:hypothetical protein